MDIVDILTISFPDVRFHTKPVPPGTPTKYSDIVWADPEADNPTAAQIRATAVEAQSVRDAVLRRDDIRRGIRRDVGDAETVNGITADGAAVCFVGLLRLVSAIAAAKNLKDLQSRIAADPISSLADDILGRMDGGEIEWPYEAKDFDQVVEQVVSSGTKVAGLIKSGG